MKAYTQKSSSMSTSSYNNNVWPNAYISHGILRHLMQIFKNIFSNRKYVTLPPCPPQKKSVYQKNLRRSTLYTLSESLCLNKAKNIWACFCFYTIVACYTILNNVFYLIYPGDGCILK